MEEYNEQIELCAEIFGKEEGAERVIDFCSSIRSEVAERLKDMPEEDRVNVYLEYYDAYAMVFSITHRCANFIKASCYSI